MFDCIYEQKLVDIIVVNFNWQYRQWQWQRANARACKSYKQMKDKHMRRRDKAYQSVK